MMRAFPDFIIRAVPPRAKDLLRRTSWYRRRARRTELWKLRCADLSKINFGCGTHLLPGWTNTDGGDARYYAPPPLPEIVKLDVWEFLAHVPDGVARFVTSEQFFEHFTRQDGHRLLGAWYRILAAGGILRI